MKLIALKFAPKDIFENILEFMVIPTFDLAVWLNEQGVILLRRKIHPYKNSWSLPGLRMMKPESIEDTLARVARKEIGITIDPAGKRFIGQYVGRFRTDHNRQDLSTCYAISCNAPGITINQEHFTGHQFIKNRDEIPCNTGAMYKHFLNLFFDQNILELDELQRR